MSELDVRASLGLAPDPSSARLARRFISDFCNAANLGEEVCQTASLLTSELVTNAVKYGGTRAVLEARMPGGALRVSISDSNPELPAVGQSPDLTAEGGRGVLLVSALATRWGVEALPSGGKAVCFELDVGPGVKSQ
jgi:anti-sigma regulatory factor (Ser/Thr protein kinase)